MREAQSEGRNQTTMREARAQPNVKSVPTATRGFRGLGPLSRYATKASGLRFPQARGPADSLPRLDSNQ